MIRSALTNSEVYRFSLVWHGDLGGELCAVSRRAFDVQPTAERFDAIRETDESRAEDGLRASDSVVAHDHRRKPVRPFDGNACAYFATFVIASATR